MSITSDLYNRPLTDDEKLRLKRLAAKDIAHLMQIPQYFAAVKAIEIAGNPKVMLRQAVHYAMSVTEELSLEVENFLAYLSKENQ